MNFLKRRVLLGGLSLIAFVSAQSPTTENVSSINWNNENKASLLRGEVTRDSKLLFKIERVGNAAYIRLPKNPTALQRGLWTFEISREGQNFFATWDKKKSAWKITLTEKGNYTIYVSKRKNNTESLAHSWFVLSF